MVATHIPGVTHLLFILKFYLLGMLFLSLELLQSVATILGIGKETAVCGHFHISGIAFLHFG